jgi:hypothetical protein
VSTDEERTEFIVEGNARLRMADAVLWAMFNNPGVMRKKATASQIWSLSKDIFDIYTGIKVVDGWEGAQMPDLSDQIARTGPLVAGEENEG